MADIQEILAGSPPSSAGEKSAEQSAADGEGAATSANVVSSTVPSGYTIEYCPDPRGYKIDGVEVPSVTTVLDVLSKPALTWWGMKIGVDGVKALINMDSEMCDRAIYGSTEEVVKLLTEHKLTVNHIKKNAATRGTNVHSALETWALTGSLAHPDDFPEEESGYVRGLNAFLADCKNRLTPAYSELMVGSKEQGFAGRFDLFAEVSEEMELMPTPRKKRIVPAGRGIFDLKTRSKFQKRESEPFQLSAYRLGMEEAGYGRSDFEFIIQVTPEGQYDITQNTKRPEHFLAVLNTWRALR